MGKDKKEKKDKKDKKTQEDSMQVDSPSSSPSKTAADNTPSGKSKASSSEKEEVPYEVRAASVSAIAHPLASKKLTKKVLKTVKKGTLFLSSLISNV
jgi:hypothetical protein